MADLSYLTNFLPYHWHMSRIRREYGSKDVERFKFDERSAQGSLGEMQVTAWISSITNDRDILFNNVLLPEPNSATGDIELDIIWLSPTGITVVEVKSYTGTIEVHQGSHWRQRFDNNSWPIKNPIDQCFRQIKALRRFLKECGLSIPVNGLIALPMVDKITVHDNARLPLITDTSELYRSTAWFSELDKMTEQDDLSLKKHLILLDRI